MDELNTMLARQWDIVGGMTFNPSEWNCTEEEMKSLDRKFGQELAASHIAFAKRLPSARKQVKELRWACEYVCGFPASSVYALPHLIVAIRELEQK